MQDNAFTKKVKQVWTFIKRMAVRAWEYLKVAKMEWIVMIGLFAADLISKAIVEATVGYGDAVTVVPYFLNIHRIHNYAAAFGSSFLKNAFGDIGARIFFSVFAVAASVAFVLVLIKNKGKSKWFRVAIAMFVAGAMGNCMDRMFLGYVRDFVEFVYFGQTWFGRQTWYVFNIADAELVVGVIMIVIYFLFMYRDTGKNKEQAELLTDELGDIDPVDATANASAENSVDGTIPEKSDNAPIEQTENAAATGEQEPDGAGETKNSDGDDQAENKDENKNTSPDEGATE